MSADFGSELRGSPEQARSLIPNPERGSERWSLRKSLMYALAQGAIAPVVSLALIGAVSVLLGENIVYSQHSEYIRKLFALMVLGGSAIGVSFPIINNFVFPVFLGKNYKKLFKG